MGICWGDPHFPTPTHTGCLKSKLQLTISSSSSSGTSKGQPTEPRSNESFPDGLIFVESSAKNFTFAELKAATRNFGRDSLLGEGGFGEVFKGLLDDKKTPSGSTKTIIAVKRHNQGSFQGRQEWLAEVNLLGRLYHPNIAKLLGYCYEDHQLLLVYEFASKGSLNNHLFGRGSMDHPLPWEIRLKIAIGAARGLAFLHTVPERPIIYRDVKTSNILLDGSYTAKLSDFGLARLGPPEGDTHFHNGCGNLWLCSPPIRNYWASISKERFVRLWGCVARDVNRPKGIGSGPSKGETKSCGLGKATVIK